MSSSTNLSFCVIGLGSMGKRRIRNLKHLGFTDITGFDTREDRCREAEQSYGIKTSQNLEQVLSRNIDAFIISVPPHLHHEYMHVAFARKIHFFVEASVLTTDYDRFITKQRETGIVAAPSCTLCFHPAIKKITELVSSGALGRISSVLYHSGQYLPDWHTYEKVSDYYVSRKETGGAREIVPFEFSWLGRTFGIPKSVFGVNRKTIEIDGAPDIDDTYSLVADYPGFILNLTVDVVSRYATRRLLINGSEKQLRWDWDEQLIRTYDPATDRWSELGYEVMPSREGYNKNITEQMYIEEMLNFVEAIRGKAPFSNTLEFDAKVLGVLYAAEESYRTGKMIEL